MTGQQHKNGVHDSDRERSVVRDQKEDKLYLILHLIGKKKSNYHCHQGFLTAR